ncbi:hypothetical protein ABFA07_022261, partial [Porites harrisoni]
MINMSSLSLVDVSSFEPVLLFLCLLICVLLSGKAARKHFFPKLPPGPWGLPVVGSCFRLGKNPHLDFTKMAQKYGDVFSLMLGNRLVVVLNGFNAIEEALIKQSTAFAGRPQLHTFKLANRTDSSITLTDYSPRWRLSRKIGVSAIQNFVKDKDTLGQKLLQESQRLVHCLKQQKGKLVDVHLPLQCATSNIITDALFGVSWSYSNKAVHNMLQL